MIRVEAAVGELGTQTFPARQQPEGVHLGCPGRESGSQAGVYAATMLDGRLASSWRALEV